MKSFTEEQYSKGIDYIKENLQKLFTAKVLC